MLLSNQLLEKVASDAVSRADQRLRLSKGLCATCVHARDCSYRHRSAQSVHFCEEFALDDGDAISVLPIREENRTEISVQSAETGPRSKGLCVNCRNRDNCRLPGHSDGVWHCEEYE